jgi:DNA-binding winged helix-turn-helix (wHTH) protein
MVYTFGDVRIDCSAFEVRRRNLVISVEPKVYDVMLHLIRHRDRVVPKDELFGSVWSDAVVGESALTRCVSLARRILGDSACIKSIYKRGYRFVGLVVERHSEALEATPASVA